MDWSFLDNADFEWKIIYPPPVSKKRKRDVFAKFKAEHSPFNQSLDHEYRLELQQCWDSMTSYRRFKIQRETFRIGDSVLLNVQSPDGDESDTICQTIGGNYAVGRIMEVRGYDENHVYLRTYVFYRPEELPGGRELYHGSKELIASNYMQIFDARTVNAKIDVRWWNEADEEDNAAMSPGLLFWRQTVNFCKGVALSKLRRHCICGGYYNPDKLLIECTNQKCKRWLHAECVEKYAVRRAYSALYPDMPWNNTAKQASLLYGRPKQGHDEPTDLSHAWDSKSESAPKERIKATICENRAPGKYTICLTHWKESAGDIEVWKELALCPLCEEIVE